MVVTDLLSLFLPSRTKAAGTEIPPLTQRKVNLLIPSSLLDVCQWQLIPARVVRLGSSLLLELDLRRKGAARFWTRVRRTELAHAETDH